MFNITVVDIQDIRRYFNDNRKKKKSLILIHF